MNGVHDLGGMHGFGPVEREADEPLFHEEWESRVFALFAPFAAASGSSVDEFRAAIEKMGAVEYLTTSYYEHWLHAFETIAVEKGIVSAKELASGSAAGKVMNEPPLPAAAVPAVVAKGASCRSDAEVPARFAPGDRVRARVFHKDTHTRMPGYVRGRVGRVERDHGVFVFPDSVAIGAGERPQRCYSVRFEARELWGPDATGNAL